MSRFGAPAGCSRMPRRRRWTHLEIRANGRCPKRSASHVLETDKLKPNPDVDKALAGGVRTVHPTRRVQENERTKSLAARRRHLGKPWTKANARVGPASSRPSNSMKTTTISSCSVRWRWARSTSGSRWKPCSEQRPLAPAAAGSIRNLSQWRGYDYILVGDEIVVIISYALDRRDHRGVRT